jgi:hypothetical protein
MQAAFARPGQLPPPAPRTAALAGLDRTSAGRASDTRELPIVQHVVGKLASANVLPHFRLAPFKEWTDLVQAKFRIPRDELAASAQRRLLTAHTGDPGCVGSDGAQETVDFTDAAAALARFGAVIEPVDALGRDQFLESG